MVRVVDDNWMTLFRRAGSRARSYTCSPGLRAEAEAHPVPGPEHPLAEINHPAEWSEPSLPQWS